MDMIKHVLEEELEDAIGSIDFYKEKINELPKGSLVKKKRKNKAYYYLAYREGKKVRFDYLGKLSDVEVEDYEKKIQRRRKLQKHLKSVEQKIRYLRKALNVRAD